MLINPSTLMTCLLLTGFLVGCGTTSRFSRGQYTSLASDPFLDMESDLATADGQSSDVMTASATDDARAEFPNIVRDEAEPAFNGSVTAPQAAPPRSPSEPVASAPPTGDFGQAFHKSPAAPPVAPEQATAASPFDEPNAFAESGGDFGRSLNQTPPSSSSSADSTADGFDAWLRENDGEVIQTRAEKRENLFGDVSPGVRHAVFSDPPGNSSGVVNPSVSTTSDAGTVERNLFADAEAAAGGASDAGDELSFGDEDAWSPPEGFDFP